MWLGTTQVELFERPQKGLSGFIITPKCGEDMKSLSEARKEKMKKSKDKIY